MLYTHFIGRIGKDAQVITGKNGDFVTMDVATDIYSKGEEKTLWVRVRSNKEGHLKNLTQYLTKGKMVLIEGAQQEPAIWNDKDGDSHVQLTISADIIKFVSFGKKRENGEKADNEEQPVPVQENTLDAPFEAPADQADDLPF